MNPCKCDFMSMWKTDNLMQEVFAVRDLAMTEAFGCLLNKTEKRENKIDEVTLKLREELQVLSDFLNNIATKQATAHKEQKDSKGH
uniref:Uncharacterized protein n=1 Tax=Arion vulgaris TaxID=1028688 RepID=A0A0B6ZUA9_9EUPU